MRPNDLHHDEHFERLLEAARGNRPEYLFGWSCGATCLAISYDALWVVLRDRLGTCPFALEEAWRTLLVFGTMWGRTPSIVGHLQRCRCKHCTFVSRVLNEAQVVVFSTKDVECNLTSVPSLQGDEFFCYRLSTPKASAAMLCVKVFDGLYAVRTCPPPEDRSAEMETFVWPFSNLRQFTFEEPASIGPALRQLD